MKIATWNVNSIKQRLEHLKTWLEANQPDALFLQELKGEDFPSAEIEAHGYLSLVKSQKAYNGVAILTRTPAQRIIDTLPGDETDLQARYIEADLNGVRLINIYLPNGNPVDTQKFSYKLAWMDRLYLHLKSLREQNIPFVIGGDFNIIPEDHDCYDPTAWSGDALFVPESRAKFRKLLNLGLTDAFRVHNKDAHHYTFWDYQAGAWQRDLGIRIDHFLMSPAITDRMISCSIDRTPRGWEKASDHTPVLLEFS
jgi:exodeoxyribonuclease-3